MSDSYNQPTKVFVRRDAIRHAVQLVTSRRHSAAVVAADHVERVKNALLKSDSPGDPAAGRACSDADIKSWRSFRDRAVGTRRPDEITVAYLAGPEPTNDLAVLLECGVRPENIWAFEVEAGAFDQGLGSLKAAGLRGVKLIPVSIEEYFIGTSRRFDIIYVDACGPLPSHEQKTIRLVANLFRHCALAPLGVLITNFSKPDITKGDALQNYAHLIAAYLYPKDFLDSEAGGFTDGADAHGYRLKDDTEPKESFFHEVCKNFDHYYGSYITRQIIDIASLIAPAARLSTSKLFEVLFDKDFGVASARAKRFVRFAPGVFDEPDSTSTAQPADQKEGDDPDDDFEMDGDAITEASMFSLVWTLAACGNFDPDADNFEAPPASVKKFLDRWLNQLCGTEPNRKPSDIIAAYYAWRHDPDLWSAAMKEIAEYPYWKMPFLCDVPTPEIGFYPTLAQLAYPAHCNIREAKRYSYVAEGKTTKMFLDVLAFDECRYVYDWLSALHLVPDDWNDLSAQLTFRFALDAIAKEIRWYGSDYLFGCHVVGESADFPMSELAARTMVAVSS